MKAMVSIFFKKLPDEVRQMRRSELKKAYSYVLYHYKYIEKNREL